MCGIICEVCYSGKRIVHNDVKLLERIKNRGPDWINSTEFKLGDGITIYFYGSVLWMQGHEPTKQPVETELGILLYNGDVFDESWVSQESDTKLIMDKLYNATNISSEQILKEIKSIKGPFSLIYYNKLTQDLFFARDKLGRNSMLLHKNNGSLIISSVLGRNYECIEVPASHICILNINNNIMKLVSWNCGLSYEKTCDDWILSVKEQQNLPDDEFVISFDEILELNDEENLVKYIENVVENATGKLNIMKRLINHQTINETVSKIIDLLQKSVEIRLRQQPNKCKQCLHDNNLICSHCAVGILFSGGLDCSILALMADKYLPEDQEIDLINVAFKKENSSSYEVPDRQTGKQSLQELQKLCPSRKWVFKEVNISREELEKMQKSVIADLVYPRLTILDESLGSALWFAAKGEDEKGRSLSRVLLLGSGADELFGGYIRHRNAYKRKGWSGLSKELLLDWSRISLRNLARDNRVICDHGRQPRMPYLDEEFSKFVLGLKPWLRCFPAENLENGIGDKLILRLVAYKLGLIEAAILPKRALQFGSRIANKKEKGSDFSKTFFNKPLP
ncbi:asparagine synthetase domain-containing protein CG17486 [Amyelois transitella]|uniref:asparagine synthetase domain-containing protein CG17486 n=1 Tax=Amyelois transitella TaxID=680683 RepID=UPI00298F6317|nr:asparagine synthetase domain-containing protein CG17486 [Amyelois transitella]